MSAGRPDDVAIRADGLGKSFGDVVALEDVDLRVPPATVLGLLGPNGAGKTTAVRILTTILQPDRGRAEVLGYDVVEQPDEVRSVIGLAGQYAAVDGNLTGRENLRMVGRLTHQRRSGIAARTEELLARFDLVDAADRPVRTYSGGMRRRLDLAAALVHRPPVLFLDEPTTGLDPRGRNDLWEVIGDLVREGTTLLLTTQYLEEAERLADQVVVIDGGRVIAVGTSDELKRRLGTTIIGVRLPDPASAERAARALAGVGPSQVTGDDRSAVEITVADAGRSVLQAVRALDHAGVVPESLSVREPTLDDVFLQLTGHRTAPGEQPPASAGSVPPRRRSRRRGAA